MIFQNNSPSSILKLVLYWEGNNILFGADSIQLGINLEWIPTPICLQSKWAIATNKKKQNISQLYNQKNVENMIQLRI